MDFKSGLDFKNELDVDQLLTVPTDTSDFQEIEVTGTSEAMNEIVDTFHLLSNKGLATNKVVALDPQYDLTIKGDADDTTILAILATRFTTDRTVPFKITDNLTGEIITFLAEMTAISSTRGSDAVVEIALTIKLAVGSIVIT